jgi:hypothetical protein
MSPGRCSAASLDGNAPPEPRSNSLPFDTNL